MFKVGDHAEFRTSLNRDNLTACETCTYDGCEVMIIDIIPATENCGGHLMYEIKVVTEPNIFFCAFEDELWKGEFYAKSQSNYAKP